MLRVMSHALTATDQRRVTLIACWIILSLAFDCVDHSLLLQRLERTFGLSGTVLCWLTSYKTDRSQQVVTAVICHTNTHSQYGSEFHRGSVLGPLLFVLYTADLSRVVASHGLVLHQYADDCRIYIITPVDDASAAVNRFPGCLDDVEAWLSSSRTLPSRKCCGWALSTN